jgi:hypothetical protein
MREFLIDENLYNMLVNAIGNANANNTVHGIQLRESYVQLSKLQPVENKEEDK